MKRFYFIIALLCVLPVTAGASFFDDDTPNPCVNSAGATFEASFSTPSTAMTPSLVKELLSAKKSIRVAARGFMSKPVSEAMVKAARGGADLKVVLDGKTNDSVYSASQFLFNMSQPPHFTKADNALASDYIVVDERDVITGNIADFADEEEEKKNAASVIIIHNAPELAKRYLANWQLLWASSEEMKKSKE